MADYIILNIGQKLVFKGGKICPINEAKCFASQIERGVGGGGGVLLLCKLGTIPKVHTFFVDVVPFSDSEKFDYGVCLILLLLLPACKKVPQFIALSSFQGIMREIRENCSKKIREFEYPRRISQEKSENMKISWKNQGIYFQIKPEVNKS